MTKEEQLKQEAEEYAEGMAKYYASTHEDCIPSQFEKYLRNAYISSAKPREKQIQIDAEQIRALQKQNGELTDKLKEFEWHDLEKNPNDLPSDNRTVLDENGNKVYYDYDIKYWRYDDEDLHITTPPIAWCELPTRNKGDKRK